MKISACLKTITSIVTLVMTLLAFSISTTAAQSNNQAYYTAQEIIDAGHGFFGSTTGALAKLVEHTFKSYGVPNGYVLGQEASGAIVGGLTYGEGVLYTKNAGQHTTFWQGPSIGLDYGGEGTRTMMLVYNLPSIEGMYGRFLGLSGSAFALAGVGVNAYKRGDVLLVPIRTGVGARLGINVGYLKVTQRPTWNPF